MKKTLTSGAIELLEHAESHLKLNSAFDKRIAFISIDTIALSHFRGIFGFNIAEICLMYGIDVENELVDVLPIDDD